MDFGVDEAAAVVALDVVVVEEELAAAVALPLGGGGIDPTGLDWHGGIPVSLGALRPAYVETNLATLIASCPTTMFWGM